MVEVDDLICNMYMSVYILLYAFRSLLVSNVLVLSSTTHEPQYDISDDEYSFGFQLVLDLKHRITPRSYHRLCF